MINEKEIDADTLYMCTLCKACEENCPVKIEFKFEELRNSFVRDGIETEANRKMVEKVRKHGNPFGKIKKGEIPDKLYCC